MTTPSSDAADAARAEMASNAEKNNTFVTFTTEGLPLGVRIEWAKMMDVGGVAKAGLMLIIQTPDPDRQVAAMLASMPDSPTKDMMEMMFKMGLANNMQTIAVPMEVEGVDSFICAIEKARAKALEDRRENPEEFKEWLNEPFDVKDAVRL